MKPNKTINVPLIDYLELMNESEFSSVMRRSAAADKVCSVNWPEEYPFCPETEFLIARSRKYLAIKFFVKGPDLRATALGDNGRSWEDSCCEFFIESVKGGYFNIETTCIGSVQIAYGEGRDGRMQLPQDQVARVIRRSSLEHKRYELEGGEYEWNLSLLIPFDILGLDADNLPLEAGVNFYKCGDLTAHPHYVSWNPVGTPGPDFHRPEYFGKLRFT